LGAAALIAAACSAAPEVSAPTTTLGTTTTTTTTVPPPTTTTTQVEFGNPYGGTVAVAEEQEPETLNPFAPRGDDLIVSIIGQTYFAGVFEIDGETLELIPEIVTELPTTSNDGVVVNTDGTMTVKYIILDEAVWEDGVPISGDDFAFTVDVLKEPEADAGYQIDEVYEWITSYEVGPKTFELTLSQPTILYQQLFRVVLPKHAVEGSNFPEDWNDQMWPSGGPYRFSSWVSGDRIVVERNDSYWKMDAETGQQLPYLDSIEFRFIPEVEDIISAFKRREVQVIQPPSSTPVIDELAALESRGVRVDAVQGRTWEHLNFQFGPGLDVMNPASANASHTYRRAVAHLVDRDAIAAAVSPYTEPLTSYVDAFSPSLSQHAWDRYSYNPARARQLISTLDADERIESIVAVFSTTNSGDTRILISEALRPMFEAVGIEYKTQLQDPLLFYGETFDNGSWDVGMWSWVGSSGFSGLITIHDAFDPEGAPSAGSNYYRWGTEDSSVRNDHTERFAEVRDLMNSTVDDTELESLVAEAEEILASRMVILPLFSYPTFGAVWEDEIAGFVQTPTQAGYTWNVEQWYRADL
jgi:peptide/nickel transport system substrate-binding protein